MIESKLQQAEKRYRELSDRLIHPDTFTNSSELQKIAKEHADLEGLVRKIKEFRICVQEKEEALVFLRGNDPEMKSLAQSEIPKLDKKIEEFEKELKRMLIPKDPNGKKNAIVEIRAGTGGDEAALLAADLFLMYSRYIEKLGMKIELVDSSPTEIG